MSRVANSPIPLPKGVETKFTDTEISVKGSKGTLQLALHRLVSVSQDGEVLQIAATSGSRQANAMAGTFRSLINNMVVGVSEGYKVQLQMVGVGFRASAQGQQLSVSLGYSHPIIMELPKEVKLEAETKKGEAPLVTLSSHDKQLLGTVAAKVRSLRKIEPYKGKGVRFLGEQVRRKAGKTAAK